MIMSDDDDDDDESTTMTIMGNENAPRPSPRGLEVLWFPLAVSRLSLELTFSMFFQRKITVFRKIDILKVFFLPVKLLLVM